MTPDRRSHRGPHPSDERFFAESQTTRLRAAVTELSWLLTRGFSLDASLKLVGDHHQLRERQRTAVRRCACSESSRAARWEHRVNRDDAKERAIALDGLNLLITIEAALSGGVLLRGRDGCLRDMSSVHGSYRTVSETDKAIALIGHALEALEPIDVLWRLDRPVSNSGKLRGRIEAFASGYDWPWRVELTNAPDKDLVKDGADGALIVTADSNILDDDLQWIDLASPIVGADTPDAWVIDLSSDG